MEKIYFLMPFKKNYKKESIGRATPYLLHSYATQLLYNIVNTCPCHSEQCHLR